MNRIFLFFSLLCFTLLLPPVSLQADDFRVSKNSPADTISTTHPSAPQQEDIKDIFGPVQLPEAPPYHLYALAVLILLALLAIILFLLKRRKNKALPLPDPAEQALAALTDAEESLEKSGTLSFAVKVTEILRWYIEQIFNIRTTRQTTTEFFNHLSNPIDHPQRPLIEHREYLEKCLSLGDVVKFAHFLPENCVVHSLADSARSFIEATRTTPGSEK